MSRTGRGGTTDIDNMSWGNSVSFISKAKVPLAFVDVNLGKAKGMQKLILYADEEPKESAANFCKLYNIGNEKQLRLEKMLEIKLKELKSVKASN